MAHPREGGGGLDPQRRGEGSNWEGSNSPMLPTPRSVGKKLTYIFLMKITQREAPEIFSPLFLGLDPSFSEVEVWTPLFFGGGGGPYLKPEKEGVRTPPYPCFFGLPI